jgi:hypothetical protein
MSDDTKRTSTPWPYWLIRYLASDDPSAFEDLISSVRGSPPYGGVSYDAVAAAVCERLEAYRGPGRAPDDACAAVEKLLGRTACGAPSSSSSAALRGSRARARAA